ncbi:DnaJ domain protein [Opisthorchis viverrini]|uniref:DnaJ domain protein n=1 Tax=Opisthorchis viverrini TaxID=6198 RepID=A0A1S8WJT9_OPIVI|nr:DnaJ domain protein [Opisthorchis viverrini]
MRCYYDLLGMFTRFILPIVDKGVPKNVESAELRKAYYKMSLQWHPDKNVSHSEDTTNIFQQIQEAYRVLSDPQERAWYDSHRAQILQSGGQKAQMGSAAGYEEERVDVFQYFTRSCFQGFDDGETGFYTVYRKVFQDITDEEVKAAEFANEYDSSPSEEDADLGARNGKGNLRSYPTFGSMESAYSEVVAPFYQFWEVFQTKKNYTWVEKYDVRCAESRAERRAMDCENRRLRNAAKKKRNEEIRQLVAFVKRRDKRVAAERERIQLAGEEAQARTKHLAKQARQRNAAQLAEAWNEELSFGGIAAQWQDVFEAELARLEAELDGASPRSNEVREAESPGVSADELEDVNSLYCLACDKTFASANAKANHESSKKHRKQVELLRQVLLEEQEVVKLKGHEYTENGADSDAKSSTSETDLVAGVASVKLTKRAKKAQRKRLKEAAKLNSVDLSDKQPVENKDPEECRTTDSGSTPGPQNPSSNQSRLPEAEAKSTISLACETCAADFPSRNQLFAHLKQTGHATLKPVALKNQTAKAKRTVRSKR